MTMTISTDTSFNVGDWVMNKYNARTLRVTHIDGNASWFTGDVISEPFTTEPFESIVDGRFVVAEYSLLIRG
jgi:hypothetical protein